MVLFREANTLDGCSLLTADGFNPRGVEIADSLACDKVLSLIDFKHHGDVPVEGGEDPKLGFEQHTVSCQPHTWGIYGFGDRDSLALQLLPNILCNTHEVAGARRDESVTAA